MMNHQHSSSVLHHQFLSIVLLFEQPAFLNSKKISYQLQPVIHRSISHRVDIPPRPKRSYGPYQSTCDLSFFSNKFLSTFALCWFDAPSSEKDNPSTPGMIRKPAPDRLASQIPYFSHSAWTLLSALHACNIWESAFWTTSDGMSFSSVKGHWPPLARVAAIIAAASGVIAVLNESNEMVA